MFRASLCPSSGEQQCSLPHMVFCTGCDGCGCVELGRELCANHSHHNRCRTPYAAVHTLVLLMMGIMMPETCWDKKFDNKHQISCILLVSLSSPWYVGVFNRVLQNELVVYCMCHRELKIFHNYFGVVSVALQRKLLKGVFSVQMSVRTA